MADSRADAAVDPLVLDPACSVPGAVDRLSAAMAGDSWERTSKASLEGRMLAVELTAARSTGVTGPDRHAAFRAESASTLEPIDRAIPLDPARPAGSTPSARSREASR